MRKKLANTFALFLSQISQILGLPGGVHRFCKKKSCLLTAYARHRRTERQTGKRSQ